MEAQLPLNGNGYTITILGIRTLFLMRLGNFSALKAKIHRDIGLIERR
jgi:hypothetical protein